MELRVHQPKPQHLTCRPYVRWMAPRLNGSNQNGTVLCVPLVGGRNAFSSERESGWKVRSPWQQSGIVSTGATLGGNHTGQVRCTSCNVGPLYFAFLYFTITNTTTMATWTRALSLRCCSLGGRRHDVDSLETVYSQALSRKCFLFLLCHSEIQRWYIVTYPTILLTLFR